MLYISQSRETQNCHNKNCDQQYNSQDTKYNNHTTGDSIGFDAWKQVIAVNFIHLNIVKNVINMVRKAIVIDKATFHLLNNRSIRLILG